MPDDHALIATLNALSGVLLWDAHNHHEPQTSPQQGPLGYNTVLPMNRVGLSGSGLSG